MARKLMAILLAVCMVVPMVLSQAFAATPAGTATYTSAWHFNGDAGTEMKGYSWLDSGTYPDKAYHLMARFVTEWLGEGGSADASIGWVTGGGLSYGFNITNGTIYVAEGLGFNNYLDSNTSYLAEVPFVLAENEYYQVDWYISAGQVKGYVNGDLLITYTGTKAGGAVLWDAGANEYIIHYPWDCAYDLLETTVVAQDESATYCSGIAQWSFLGDWGSAAIAADYTVDTYEIIDWQPYANTVIAMIDAIGTVGYNEWVPVTDTNCMSYEAAAGWGPYTDVQAGLTAPSRIEMDVQLVENKDGESLIGGFPHSGGGAFLGYNVDAGKFYIGENRGYPDYDTKYAITNAVAATEGTITLDTSKVYTIGLVYASNYVAIEFQGKEVLRSTAYSFASGDIHLPVVNAKFNFFGYRVSLLSSGVITQEDNWSAFSSNATLGKGITCTADKLVNSGAAIAEARAAYDAANAETKALVSNYDVLTAAEATYSAKVQAVAQDQADVVIALINAIGTPITLDSLDAILAAEEAYSDVDPVVQALVSNYATLTAARAQYDAYVAQKAALEAKINSIGTVYYQQETNRDTDYDNSGIRFDYTRGDGYSNQKINGGTELAFDYRMQFDFQVRAVEEGNNFAQLAGGAQNFVVGYDFPTQRFVLIMEEGHGGDHNPWTNLDPEDANAISVSDVYPLLPDCVYNWNLEVKGNRVTLFIDGQKVVELANGTAENTCRKDGNYFIFYPRGCVVDFANYVWQLYFDLGDGQGTIWRNWGDECPLSGQALADSQVTWGSRGAGYINSVFPLHADAILDDGALIAECEDDYAALDDYAKTIISNYATLTAARDRYDMLANDPAVGAVIAQIQDLGEITLESGEAIANAEAAYAALSAAQQAQVTNYADLTAARATYDALVAAKERADRIAAVEAAIDAIGTVGYVADPTAVDDGILVDVLNYSDKGYCHVESLNAGNPFTIEYDFVTVANGNQDASWTGFGLSNGIGAGYSYKNQKFFITAESRIFGSTAERLLTCASDEFPLEANTIYHIKFDFGTSESAIYVDGVKVVSSTEQLCAGSSWCIFYPAYCSYKMSNLTITSNGTTLCEGLKGQALASNTVWPFTEYFNSVGLVPMLVDSESAILDARSAYDALAADEQADVSNYATLTAAEAAYEALKPAPAILWGDANDDGVVDLRDASLIAQYANDDTIVLGAGADANGDSIVDLRDASLLAQYANDDTIVLGPVA